MATKHEQILSYIDSLDVGEKISVRRIAKEMKVSEGTAYRAIKDAENKGFVSTIERVGTIRIEQKKKENIEKLTYAEVVNVIDGQVLGGRTGLHKTLNKFVIGAMELDAMMRYTADWKPADCRKPDQCTQTSIRGRSACAGHGRLLNR